MLGKVALFNNEKVIKITLKRNVIFSGLSFVVIFFCLYMGNKEVFRKSRFETRVINKTKGSFIDAFERGQFNKLR